MYVRTWRVWKEGGGGEGIGGGGGQEGEIQEMII